MIITNTGIFITTAQYNAENSIIRNGGQVWGRNAMQYDARYEIVQVTTQLGRKFEALRMVPGSITTQIVNVETLLPVTGQNQLLFPIDPSHNCFGYIFTNGDLLIDRLEAFQGILADEYSEVNMDQYPEIIVFHEHHGYDDNGDVVYIPSHAVKIDGPSLYSYKPGINLPKTVTSADYITDSYNYNVLKYYKKVW